MKYLITIFVLFLTLVSTSERPEVRFNDTYENFNTEVAEMRTLFNDFGNEAFEVMALAFEAVLPAFEHSRTNAVSVCAVIDSIGDGFKSRSDYKECLSDAFGRSFEAEVTDVVTRIFDDKMEEYFDLDICGRGSDSDSDWEPCYYTSYI